MQHVHPSWRSGLAAVTVGLALSLAACGGSDSSSSSSTDSPPAAADVNKAGATKILAPFTGKPSSFPVDRPLPGKLPADTKMAYVQCATPICGIFSTIFPGATKAIGAKFDVVKAGASAESLQSAFSSAIEKKPSGLLLPAVEPASISAQLKDAKSEDLPISANGIMDADKFGIGAQQLGRPTAELAGRILAAWVVDRKGADAKPVFYTTPELSFSEPIRTSFESTLEELCSSCKARFEDVPVSSIGSTAPNLVVSDLQSNPDSNVAVFSTQEASTGLPAALKTAGLKIETVGFAPNPAILQDIKSGGATAGLGLDLAVMSWTQVDALARLILDAPLTEGQKSTIPPMQMLTKKDLDFDVTKGWTGYPDFPQRFAKLWSGAS